MKTTSITIAAVVALFFGLGLVSASLAMRFHGHASAPAADAPADQAAPRTDRQPAADPPTTPTQNRTAAAPVPAEPAPATAGSPAPRDVTPASTPAPAEDEAAAPARTLASTTQPSVHDSALDGILVEMTGARVLDQVRYLSETIGERVVCTPREREAVDYIAREFRASGYDVQIQPFTPARRSSHSYNVIASRPQTGKPWLVVGAHLDSVPGAAGANDNASGVGVILETARILARHPGAYDVTFVAFGSEELSHDGSKYYVSQLRELPAGMINLDMVGVGKDFQIGQWHNPDPWLVDHCWQIASQLGYHPQVNPPFTGKSDYASFADRGVPIACYVWDPDDHHHTPNDRLEMLNLEDFRQRLEITGRSLLAALLTPAPARRRAG